MDVWKTNGYKSLADEVKRLEDHPPVRKLVETRIADFLEVHKRDSLAWFTELVYCLLTAYSSAERSQLCVDALNNCNLILNGSVEEVAETLRSEGHRFADRRAEYIIAARELAPTLKSTVRGFEKTKEAREWLVKKVKGLGWKEASHFLRNVGYLDVAILDRHILSNMTEYGLIDENGRKGLSKRRYLEYECVLKKVADSIDIPLGKMDLYLWFRKTGKVLK